MAHTKPIESEKSIYGYNKYYFRNISNDFSIINAFGSTLYASDMRFLRPKITYNRFVSEPKTVTLYWKIIRPDGSIFRNDEIVPAGYTESCTYTIYPGMGKTLELHSCGRLDISIYPSDTYYLELYYNDNRIYRQPFTIY